MSKPSNVTAKDLAFERERMTWKRKFRAERENHEKELEDLKRQLEEKDDLLRSKDDWIERLLEYTELDRDDIAEVVEMQRKAPKSDPVISNVVASIARGVMAAMPDAGDKDAARPDRTVMSVTDGIDLTARIDRGENAGASRLVIDAEGEGDDEVRELPHLVALSRRMMTTIKLNMSFSMTLNFIAIALAIIGTLSPVIGALVHNAGSVLVIANSALLLNWRKK